MSEIFLSHSGKQKPFVRRLKDALQSAGHSPFFDEISLPKAEPFPLNIEEALQKCKLGVVVLSEEFMMSHWPMRELAFLRHHNPSAKIFPLFYTLSPHDLKSDKNLPRWRAEWEEIGKRHGVDTSQWEEVVRLIPPINGEEFRPGPNEDSYINKVVKEICRLVPLSPRYDVHGVIGGSGLCEVIMSKFQTAQSLCKSISCACTIALHGVGGVGKTTICKLMANAYSTHYPGKSLWLEFPTDGNKKSIAEECKKLLRQCTNASDEHVLSKATSLDEIFPELDKRMAENDVFLAIDNVWDNTLEGARRLLKVKFSKESKILITSRSRPVLKDLLEGCDEATCIHAVPSMKREEALRTFEMSFGDVLSLYVPDRLLDEVLEKCLFEDGYHPLALKALGKMLKRMQGEVKANISRLSLGLVNATIETLIRTNYDNIPSISKLMFLDIVVVFLSDAFCGSRFWGNGRIPGGYDAIQKGLRILYVDERHSKENIDDMMHQLAWDGLLDFEGVDDDRRIKVHDLYLELAKGEARASPRFFLGGGQENRIDWSMVKRVILPVKESNKMVKVIKQNCPELEVLIASGKVNWLEQHLYSGELQLAEHMGALRILILQTMFLDISTSRFRSEEGRCSTGGGMRVDGWRGCVRRLAWLELTDCRWVNAVEAVYDMDRLEVLFLNSCRGPWKNQSKLGHGCGGLEEYGFIVKSQFRNNKNEFCHGCGGLEEFIFLEGSLNNLKKLQLSGVRNLNSLTVNGANLQLLKLQRCCNLQEICSLGPLLHLITLSVSHCYRLQAITGLNGATQLQQIHLKGNKTLKEIPGLHDLINLQTMRILDCQSLFLKSMHFICSSRKLQVVELRACKTCEEIEIPGLVDLNIYYCHRLKSITLSEASQLQKFFVSSCEGLEKIVVKRDGAHGQLQSFMVRNCDSLEEIQGLHGFFNIKSFSIVRCRLLKSIPDQLSSARAVEIESCGSLEEIQALSGLINLEWFRISNCPRLKAIPPLSCDVQLIRGISIRECGSLEEIQAVSGLINLQFLIIRYCPNLKQILLDLSGAVQLGSINIGKCGSLEEIPALSGLFNLQSLHIEKCPRLIKVIPNQFSCGTVSGLINLKSLKIRDCPRLKAVLLDLTGAVQLESIEFKSCESLEEIPTLHLSKLEFLYLEYCPRLKAIPDLSGVVWFVHIGQEYGDDVHTDDVYTMYCDDDYSDHEYTDDESADEYTDDVYTDHEYTDDEPADEYTGDEPAVDTFPFF